MTRNNWHTSTRPKRGPDYWRNRAKALKAAGGQCVIRLPGICTGKATQADHIIPVHAGGTDDAANLRASCPECNAELNYRTRPRPPKRTTKRAPEKHPGLID